MNIANQNCNSILISSPILQDSEGTTIRLQLTLNCCSTIFDDEILLTGDNNIVLAVSSISDWITLKSGIYSAKVIVTDAENIVTIDENCSFIDCDFSCKFSDAIKNMLSDEMTKREEIINFLMLHYTLTYSSNCGCNCSELCDIYKQLYKLAYGTNLILDTQTSNISDCGCH